MKRSCSNSRAQKQCRVAQLARMHIPRENTRRSRGGSRRQSSNSRYTAHLSISMTAWFFNHGGKEMDEEKREGDSQKNADAYGQVQLELHHAGKPWLPCGAEGRRVSQKSLGRTETLVCCRRVQNMQNLNEIIFHGYLKPELRLSHMKQTTNLATYCVGSEFKRCNNCCLLELSLANSSVSRAASSPDGEFGELGESRCYLHRHRSFRSGRISASCLAC